MISRKSARRFPPVRMPLDSHWEWQYSGRCRGLDPETFFPGERESGAERDKRVAQAKSVCGCCPVIRECQDYALAAREPHGVWGGLTAYERETLLARHDDRSA